MTDGVLDISHEERDFTSGRGKAHSRGGGLRVKKSGWCKENRYITP